MIKQNKSAAYEIYMFGNEGSECFFLFGQELASKTTVLIRYWKERNFTRISAMTGLAL
jgi:hypothetical protein